MQHEDSAALERERDERQRVIAYARTWLKTPFRHQSDVRASGVDCAMLLVRVFVDTGMVEPFDPGKYPQQFFLHRDEERFLGWLNRYALEIAPELAKPGDVVVYKMGRVFAHGALIVSDREIINAWAKERQVAIVERNTIELTHFKDNTPRPAKYFDLWAKRRLSEAQRSDESSGANASCEAPDNPEANSRAAQL
jgi:cell wall-associated NlpC family hydrolase